MSTSLAIYLNDHLGLIAGEIELARRVASENDGTPLATTLSVYSDEVAAQRDSVKNILASLGQRPSSIKQAAGWLAEKVGRLKPNDALTGYTDLARVIELETLVCAAHARRMMWQTLCKLDHHTEEAADWNERSSQQMDVLQEHHQQALRLAFETG